MAHRWAALSCLGLLAAAAHAQFAMVPRPVRPAAGALQASQALDERAYRVDAGRHIYAAYPSRVMQGMMPPLMHAVLVTETVVDAKGAVKCAHRARTRLCKGGRALGRADDPPCCAAAAAGQDGRVRYVEIWLVDKSGRFQVHSLTEGQR